MRVYTAEMYGGQLIIGMRKRVFAASVFAMVIVPGVASTGAVTPVGSESLMLTPLAKI